MKRNEKERNKNRLKQFVLNGTQIHLVVLDRRQKMFTPAERISVFTRTGEIQAKD